MPLTDVVERHGLGIEVRFSRCTPQSSLYRYAIFWTQGAVHRDIQSARFAGNTPSEFCVSLCINLRHICIAVSQRDLGSF